MAVRIRVPHAVVVLGRMASYRALAVEQRADFLDRLAGDIGAIGQVRRLDVVEVILRRAMPLLAVMPPV